MSQTTEHVCLALAGSTGLAGVFHGIDHFPGLKKMVRNSLKSSADLGILDTGNEKKPARFDENRTSIESVTALTAKTSYSSHVCVATLSVVSRQIAFGISPATTGRTASRLVRRISSSFLGEHWQ